MKKIKDVDQFVDSVLHLVNGSADKTQEQLKNGLKNLLNQHLQIDASVQAREVTILLSDIRGFTSLSEKYSAAEIVNMLNNYFSQMNEIINQYGGVIDKYMGDAIMVVFGVPESLQDDAHRAVACAVEMQMAMDQVNHQNRELEFPEFFTGIGINTGLVSAGRLGSEIHEEFTVIGDGVNLASRIESYSLRGQVLISQHTYELLKNVVEVGKKNTVRVKGKSEMVDLYEVRSIHWNGKQLKVPEREVRNSIRLDMDAEFSYQLIKGKKVLDELLEGKIKDLSYNGMFAILNHEVEPFTNIKIALTTSLVGGKTRDIYAKIISVRKMQSGYGCGIEFTSLDADSQQSIKNYIDRIIEGS